MSDADEVSEAAPQDAEEAPEDTAATEEEPAVEEAPGGEDDAIPDESPADDPPADDQPADDPPVDDPPAEEEEPAAEDAPPVEEDAVPEEAPAPEEEEAAPEEAIPDEPAAEADEVPEEEGDAATEEEVPEEEVPEVAAEEVSEEAPAEEEATPEEEAVEAEEEAVEAEEEAVEAEEEAVEGGEGENVEENGVSPTEEGKVMKESLRAEKCGYASECQQKVEANYDEEEARKCLHWIRLMTGVEEIPEDPQLIDPTHDNFYNILSDGVILCKLIDRVSPNSINLSDKMFQTPKIDAMRLMRERERIAEFCRLVQEMGVDDAFIFPTESLHEPGALNLSQVGVCIRALGIQAQTQPGYDGPEGFWPRKSEKSVRDFTDVQLKAGQSVISLQYGTNKGASQAGMNASKPRRIPKS